MLVNTDGFLPLWIRGTPRPYDLLYIHRIRLRPEDRRNGYGRAGPPPPKGFPDGIPHGGGGRLCGTADTGWNRFQPDYHCQLRHCLRREFIPGGEMFMVYSVSIIVGGINSLSEKLTKAFASSDGFPEMEMDDLR